MSRIESPIRQIAGIRGIAAALHEGVPISLVLVQRDPRDPAVPGLAGRARAAGIPVHEASESVLRRMSPANSHAEILALVGRRPQADLSQLMTGEGIVWLLVGASYPGNVGMAIRTAEVSGADGVVIDSGFARSARKAALRASVRADWFMPVLWESAETVLGRAEEQGRRIIGIEDVGTRAPWEVDLTVRALLVVGGEREGIPPQVLERCGCVVRIPMAGFIPSYNLQAAVAALATERQRQHALLS